MAAMDATHQFDVWKCGSCIVLDENGAEVTLKLFARMGKRGKPSSKHELALFGVTTDACYGHRGFSRPCVAICYLCCAPDCLWVGLTDAGMTEKDLCPERWPGQPDYWTSLGKILERHYPCHYSNKKIYQQRSEECAQKAQENDPRCCQASFVDSTTDQRSISIQFGYQDTLQMFQAGGITIKYLTKRTLFADHMAQNLMSYQDIIAEKIARVDDLTARNTQLQKQVQALLHQKETTEKTLYAKFLCVLNEKKRKIRELQEEAESGRTTAVRLTLQPPTATTSSQHTFLLTRGSATTCMVWHDCQGGSPIRESNGSDNDSEGEDSRKRSRRMDSLDNAISTGDENRGFSSTTHHQGTLDTLGSLALSRTKTLSSNGSDTGRGAEQTLSQVPATVSEQHFTTCLVISTTICGFSSLEPVHSSLMFLYRMWYQRYSYRRTTPQALRSAARPLHLREEGLVGVQPVGLGPRGRLTHHAICLTTCENRWWTNKFMDGRHHGINLQRIKNGLFSTSCPVALPTILCRHPLPA